MIGSEGFALHSLLSASIVGVGGFDWVRLCLLCLLSCETFRRYCPSLMSESRDK